jgi:predicted DNA binding protein
MLFKVVRENETTYYVPEHIRKISISPVYGHDDSYDVAFYIDNTIEIVKVFDDVDKAEAFVKKIYEMMNKKDDYGIVDLSTLA